MRIGIVSPYEYSYPGGVNNHVDHLVRSLRRRGFHAQAIATCARGAEVPEYLLPITGRTVTVPSGGSISKVNASPSVPFQVRRILRREQFDIVHLHNPLAVLISISFLWNRQAAPGTAFVGTFHEYRDTPNPLIEIAKPLVQRWVERLDGRIAVSSAALEFNSGYFPDEWAVIPNGVDVARFADPGLKPLPQLAAGEYTVLFVGRLEERKGFPYLLQAFEHVRHKVPDARLLVVGAYDSQAAAPYVRYARQHMERDVLFVGQVSDADLPRYYRAAQVFCAPSVDFESFGIVLLEAMAAGVPIIASDIAGYREVIDDGQQGLLVPARSPAALGQAIVDLLSDSHRRDEMGRAGLAKAWRYDWQRVTDEIVDFYTAVLGKRSRQRTKR